MTGPGAHRARHPHRARHRWRNRPRGDERDQDRDDDAGFSTLEAVIVIPVVVMMTMIVVQSVLLYHARNVAEAAARDGLRVARGYRASAAQGEAAAERYLTAVAPTLLTHRTCVVQRTPTTAVIVCRAHVASVVPFWSYSLTERATGPVEIFATGS